MSERKYPYTGWVLQPSFKPKAVVFVEPYRSYSREDYGDIAESGALKARSEIYLTERDAFDAAYAKLAAMEADLEVKRERLAKRRATLDKASKAQLAVE